MGGGADHCMASWKLFPIFLPAQAKNKNKKSWECLFMKMSTYIFMQGRRRVECSKEANLTACHASEKGSRILHENE